jgi:hypothetical protein
MTVKTKLFCYFLRKIKIRRYFAKIILFFKKFSENLNANFNFRRHFRENIHFLALSCCPVLVAILTVLSCPGRPVRSTCPNWSVSPVLPQFTRPKYPTPTIPLRVSCNVFPILVVLSLLSCRCFHVLAILASLSCSGCNVLSRLSSPAVLSRLSCTGCPVTATFPSCPAPVFLYPALLSPLSCPCCHVLIILSYLFLYRRESNLAISSSPVTKTMYII